MEQAPARFAKAFAADAPAGLARARPFRYGVFRLHCGRTGGKSMSQFITFVVGTYAALVGALFLLQRNLLYYPDTSVPSPAASGVAEMTPVTLQTDDGLALLSWYGAADGGQPSIVFFHGNAGHIGSRGVKARLFLDAGFGVLLVGYRGYGGNPGKPTEDGFYADGQAALDFLAERGVKAETTVLYGESLGTGVAVHLAHRQAARAPVAAVVLEAPYTGIAEVAAYHYPFVPARWLVRDRFDSAAKIAHIEAPVLIFHGERDRTIPPKFGRALFAVAAEPKESRWFERGNHNDLYDFGAGQLVINFIRRRLGEAGTEGETNHPNSGSVLD